MKENPGYSVVKSKLTPGPAGQRTYRRETVTRDDHSTPATTYVEHRVETYTTNRGGLSSGSGNLVSEVDTDHDSIADEVDFGDDEPAYKSANSSYRASRSRDVDGMLQYDHMMKSWKERSQGDLICK